LKLWTDHWTKVNQEVAPLDSPSLVGLGHDGASVAVTFRGEKTSQLRELSADTQTWSNPVPSPDGLIWDPATYRLIGQQSLAGDELDYQFSDPKDQATWKSVRAAYKDSLVRLVGFSDDHRKFDVVVDSPTE